MSIQKYELMSQGIYVSVMPSTEQLRELVKSLWPVETEHQFIRVGGDYDGGYLLPNDFEGIRACYSPGIGSVSTFEQAMLDRAIPSHLMDSSVAPPENFNYASYEAKFLGHKDSVHEKSLASWIASNKDDEHNDDLLLQIDIEGAEYRTLLATPAHVLQRFRMICLEVHDIEAWGATHFFDLVKATFEKLQEHFYIVHLHPNNCCGVVNLNGINIPRVFELTLHRKDRVKNPAKYASLPHPLDRPNLEQRPDLVMPPISDAGNPTLPGSKFVEHAIKCEGDFVDRLVCYLIGLVLAETPGVNVRLHWVKDYGEPSGLIDLVENRDVAVTLIERGTEQVHHTHFDSQVENTKLIQAQGVGFSPLAHDLKTKSNPAILNFEGAFAELDVQQKKALIAKLQPLQQVKEVAAMLCKQYQITKHVKGLQLPELTDNNLSLINEAYQAVADSTAKYLIITDDDPVKQAFSKLKNCLIYDDRSLPLESHAGARKAFNQFVKLLVLSQTTVQIVNMSTFATLAQALSEAEYRIY